MNLDSAEVVIEEGSLPNGYNGWAEVPDHIVPVKLVEGSSVGKVNPPTSRRAYLKGQLQLDWLVAVTNSGHSKALQVALAVKISNGSTARDLGQTALSDPPRVGRW